MFGYVRPLEGELKVCQLEEYKAVYCGLCHGLGKRCGFLARFVLNYDFVFLAMLLDEGTECCVTVRRRCVAHPFRRRKCADCHRPAMELAVDETVILAYYKLLDDFHDEGLGRRLLSRMMALLLTPAFRRARRNRPDFAGNVKECLAELAALEREGAGKLDRACDAFARILRSAAQTAEEPSRRRILEQLLYHLGRWIYLIDGLDDQPEDTARGRYNPITARFGPEPDAAYLKSVLNNSLTAMGSAFQLLEPNRWNPILENILYLGLPAVQNSVFKRREMETA